MPDGGNNRLRMVAAAISAFAESTTDYSRLLKTVAQQVGDIVQGFCAIASLSEDGIRLEPLAWSDADAEAAEICIEVIRNTTLHPASPDPPVEVLRTHQPLLLESVDENLLAMRVAPERHQQLRQVCIRSAILAPLRYHGRVTGLLVVNRYGPEARTLELRDVLLVQSLADHAALAIVNAQLFRDSLLMTARLQTLADIGREFALRTGVYQDLLGFIAKRVAELVGDMCAIQLVSEDGAWADLCAIHHTNPDLIEAATKVGSEPRLPVGEGMTGRIMASGAPLLVARISSDELTATVDPLRRPWIEKLAITSLMGAPLISEGRTLGSITMARSHPSAGFANADLQLLSDLASHAAIAISNSRALQRARTELQERQTAEEALLRTEEQLRQSQKMDAVGRLAGGLAHDFNNMLSVILSYSDLVCERLPTGDSVRHDVEQIGHAGRRAAELTRQLLAFSRQQVASPRSLDVTDLIRRMSPMLRRLVNEDVRLNLTGLRATKAVLADASHLEQVVMNLVVNARDAMPNGGTLVVETSDVTLDESYARSHLGVTPGPHVMLAVSDTGQGMDKKTQERVFEPFFTTKAKGKGTGLGLSTVFGIVKQAGGNIWIYSEPGKGSTFKVYLPCTGLPPTVDEPHAPVVRQRGSATILLVEDEEQLRLVAQSILEAQGYRVLAASDGAAALNHSARETGSIDLLLTDVVMPGISGRELARQILLLRPGIRVLYMSGYTENAIVHHGVLDEGVALLQKPVTPDLLLDKVQRTLAAPAP